MATGRGDNSSSMVSTRFLSLVWLVVTLACAGLLTSARVDAQLLGAFSEEEEIELGRRAAEEMEQDLQLLDDGDIAAYISDLGQRLAEQSARPGIAYQFKVVDTAEINAFALPGGFIYVHRGLIDAADDESELVGVLGHEIGHVVARHGAKQAQRATYANLGLSVLGSVLGNSARSQLGGLAAEMVTAGTFMKFGRDAEREADRLGVQNVVDAGYDPNGMMTFFEKLDGLRAGRGNAVERFFASHPEPAERVANVQDLVEAFGHMSDLARSSRRFEDVKLRLASLPPPPGPEPAGSLTAESAADGSPDSLSSTAADAVVADPVPMSYPGTDVDYQIAARFAPVFHQALGSSPRFDYITRFDFDGDWRGDNNWANAADTQYPLTATVYFNVSESPTHYFIHYAAFHPRDYKGGNVRGVVLSQVLRETARRHGDYDPTGLSQAAVLAHENDMEGALVVVEKAQGLFGSTRVAYVETLAHNQFLQYQVDRRFFGGSRADAIRVEDEHAVLYIEPKGHGIEAYHGGDQLDDDDVDGFVVYQYAGQAEEPTGQLAGIGMQERVGYELVSLTETLWHYAKDRHTAIFDGTFDYQDWSVQVQDTDGTVRQHDVSLGEVSSLLRGVVGGVNMARPPWGWYDQDEEGQRQGSWFLTPAETVKWHFGLDDEFSTTYLHHPALGHYRDGQPD